MPEVLNPILSSPLKGYPGCASPCSVAAIGGRHWNVLRGDCPLPLAVVHNNIIDHNIHWMQRFAVDHHVELAPHGKTTMSPQIFRRQLDAGAWGITFATVEQAMFGVTAGVRRIMIANQIIQEDDLECLAEMQGHTSGLELFFLMDSLAQLRIIEGIKRRWPAHQAYNVLLEIGVPGGRTGCRSRDAAVDLARAIHSSDAVSLCGIECFEGLGASGEESHDRQYVDSLMRQVAQVASFCDTEQYFDRSEILVSAGGSALFDLVTDYLKPALTCKVRGLLRSGCYVTHDHGYYAGLVRGVNNRTGWNSEDGLRPALEIWTRVQSVPEDGLAILTAGRRDVSFDLGLPIPIKRARRGAEVSVRTPASWQIVGLNDQHAYLRWDVSDQRNKPEVGEYVGLGISHPCTTFDKWRWMALVNETYDVTGAITTFF